MIPEHDGPDVENPAFDGFTRRSTGSGPAGGPGRLRRRDGRAVRHPVGAQAFPEPVLGRRQGAAAVERRRPGGVEVCARGLVQRPRDSSCRLHVHDPPGELAEIVVEVPEGDGDVPRVGRQNRKHRGGLLQFLPLEPDAADTAADGQEPVVARHRMQPVRHRPA